MPTNPPNYSLDTGFASNVMLPADYVSTAENPIRAVGHGWSTQPASGALWERTTENIPLNAQIWVNVFDGAVPPAYQITNVTLTFDGNAPFTNYNTSPIISLTPLAETPPGGWSAGTNVVGNAWLIPQGLPPFTFASNYNIGTKFKFTVTIAVQLQQGGSLLYFANDAHIIVAAATS